MHFDNCPACGTELGALGRYCEDCGGYTADLANPGRAVVALEATPPAVEQPHLGLPEQSEDEIQQEIKGFLEVLPGRWRVVDTSQGQRAQITRGLPDLLIYGPDCYIEVEVKRPGQKRRPDQLEHARLAKAAGVTCVVWMSVNDAARWWRERQDGERKVS